MTNLNITNSPVGAKRYHRSKRLMFLFAGLRTRSLLARNELASIALGSSNSAAELINRVRTGLLSKQDISNLGAFRDLAWLLSNQIIHASDLEDALELYDWSISKFGWRRLPHMHRVAYAITALRLAQVDKAQAAVSASGFESRLKWSKVLANLVPRIAPTTRVQQVGESLNAFFMFGRDYSLPLEFLLADIANPFRSVKSEDFANLASLPSTGDWVNRLSAQLIGPRFAKLQLASSLTGSSGSEIAPFDMLSANQTNLSSVTEGPLVTVVMSAFEPNEHIFTAINSVLSQTYKNLELLVIDDASPLSFDGVLERVAALDARVRVLRQTTNGGTYRIRNRALDEARGELITFQDSDDWMHPQRIEMQVAHLVAHADQVANISMSTRLTDRLEAAESGRRLRVGICEPALMFWRQKVRDRVGYFDTVRKGGDTEYRKRLQRAFAKDCAMVAPWRTLTIQRADNGGLTQGELSFRWITEFRTHYRDSYLRWHREAAKSGALKLQVSETRAFYAPRQSALVGAEARAPQNFNLVVAANFRDPVNTPVALAKIQAALDAGLSVALLQVNSMYPLHMSRAISGETLALLDSGRVQLVQPGFELQVGKLEMLAPNAWLSSYSAEVFAWRVAEVWPTAPVDAAESFVLTGPGLATELEHQLVAAFGAVALVKGS